MSGDSRVNHAFEESDNEEKTDKKTKKVLSTDEPHILSMLYGRYEKYVNFVLLALLLVGYHAYFVYCIVRHLQKGIPIWDCSAEPDCKDRDKPYWCQSLAFLIVLTILVYAGVLYGYVVKPLFGEKVARLAEPVLTASNRLLQNWWVVLLVYLVSVGGILAYLIYNAVDDTRRFVSIGGYFILVAIGWITSVHPRRVKWRQVVWGFVIQFMFALVVLKWPFGKDLINCLGSKVESFLSYADSGSEMIYGHLVTGKPFLPDNYPDSNVREVLTNINEGGFFGNSGMMFKVLSLIYFLSFFVSMLYYLGVLQFVVLKLGWLLSVTMQTTAAESMNAAANIFLGQTEAPLLIKPFLPLMTKSEIHAVMTGGFATIAGTMLGAYIGIGIDPTALITASVMAAPTALAVSKLFYPETEESRTTINDVKVEKGDDVNVLDAAAKGASSAIMLVLNIAASLIAFKSFIAFLDGVMGWFGAFAGDENLTFQTLLGYALWPLAWIMGVQAQDCEQVARLIGMKVLITEFPAFLDLGDIRRACEADADSQLYKEGCTLDDRSITIATFALCGFANFASLGIQIGGMSALAPERKSDFAQVVLRAMIAGCWVSFLNACLAGALL